MAANHSSPIPLLSSAVEAMAMTTPLTSSWSPDVTLRVTSAMTCSMPVSNNTEGSAAGASIASPIVMFMAGIVGNVLALVVLHRTKAEIRSMVFYTLVAALTWNDLIGILLTSPVPLASYVNGRRMPAQAQLCRFHGFAMVCFGLSTPLIVCAMAVERTMALKCSYFYSKYGTSGYARLLVLVLWAFVLLFGALPLFGVGGFSLQYPCTWCFLNFRSREALDMFYAYAYAILNLAVVVVMTFCNALVMTTLCQVRRVRRKKPSNLSVNSSLLQPTADPPLEPLPDEEKNGDGSGPVSYNPRCQTTAGQQQSQQGRRRQSRDVELQMIWLVCAITTIFAVCWVPLMAYILYSLQSEDNHEPLFGLVAVRLASLNQTLNPWIYVILRKSLLARLRSLCCAHCQDDGEPFAQSRRLQNLARPPTKFQASPRLLLLDQGPGLARGPNNYVHVGHQLCPSSQYVGQRNSGSESGARVSLDGRSGSGSGGGGGSGNGEGGSGHRHPRQHSHHHRPHQRGKNGKCAERSSSCQSCSPCCSHGRECGVETCSGYGGGRQGGPEQGERQKGWAGVRLASQADDEVRRQRLDTQDMESCSLCRHEATESLESCPCARTTPNALPRCSHSGCPGSDSSTLTPRELKFCSHCSQNGDNKSRQSVSSDHVATQSLVSAEDLARDGDQERRLLCYNRSVYDEGGSPDGGYVDVFSPPRNDEVPNITRPSHSDAATQDRDQTIVIRSSKDPREETFICSSTSSSSSSCSSSSQAHELRVSTGFASVVLDVSGKPFLANVTLADGETQDSAQALAKVTTSDVEDHGYGSRVGSDTSRTSTPENRRTLAHVFAATSSASHPVMASSSPAVAAVPNPAPSDPTLRADCFVTSSGDCHVPQPHSE